MSGWGNTLARTVGRFRPQTAAEINAIADSLEADAAAARRLREYQRHPDVVALNIERSRDRLDRAGWALVIGGLLYTTVNVTLYVLGEPKKDANGAPLPWALWQIVPAGLVEPLMMGLLIIFLRGEQIAGRFGFTTGPWPRWTRWTALGFTYLMNTGASWEALSPKGIVIHSIPVILVFAAAEALAAQRLALTSVATYVSTTSAQELDARSLPAPALVKEIAPGTGHEEVVETVDEPEPDVAPDVVPDVAPEPDNGPDTEEIDLIVDKPEPQPDLFDWLREEEQLRREQERREQDEQKDEVPAPNGTGKRGRPKGKERLKLEWAYAKLREELGPKAIGPALIDRKAEVPSGTAKRVWKQIAADYEAAQQEGEVRINGQVVPA